jgi:hypothetical protein
MSQPAGVELSRALANAERTRKQIQELEALLQRMLDIPVSAAVGDPEPAAEKPAAPLVDWQPEPDPLTRALDEAAGRTPAVDIPSEPAILDRTEVVPPPQVAPAVSFLLDDSALEAERKPEGALLSLNAEGGPAVAVDVVVLPPVQEPAVEPGWVHACLLWVDAGYDGLVGLLGPLGRCLRAQGVKNALGWFGVVLLLAAAGIGLGAWLASR